MSTGVIQYTIRRLEIPMRVSFKHASAERTVSESVWVEAKRGTLTGLGEGCPRRYVTGETLDGAIAWAQAKVACVSANVTTLASLKHFVDEHRSEIDTNPSAWCAIELATLDLLAQEQNVSIERLLGVNESKTRFQYTAVLSADDPAKYEKNLKRFLRFGFSDFKLKVVADASLDYPRIDELKTKVSPGYRLLWPPVRLLASTWATRSPLDFRLRLDGNNAWAGREQEIYPFLDKIPLRPWAIEEPFAAHDFRAMAELSQREQLGIILDESLCNWGDIARATKHEARWVANLRVSKMGGLLRSLAIVDELKKQNWEIIVGAQVGETSVLSRAALVVARAAGDLLTAQEGAFGSMLLEKDIAQPEIKFGLAGILQNPSAQSKGLGLRQES
ncbi:MAG TPA: enolase C-terminal domain-like protein [Bdellovibrionota bacterium]|jgi:L-alanine-DL-glutamate epimerase-like enolase superfamily enzyme|nr:enolase C-terminal domain-like protein [Bdellovibrionota bacterium]